MAESIVQSSGGAGGVPPRIDPAHWEQFATFRETFLIYLTTPRDLQALREVGAWLFTLVTESRLSVWRESSTRTELRAALADLRHLEGFVASVGREHVISSLATEDTVLSLHARALAAHLGALADDLDATLGTPPTGEEEGT